MSSPRQSRILCYRRWRGKFLRLVSEWVWCRRIEACPRLMSLGRIHSRNHSNRPMFVRLVDISFRRRRWLRLHLSWLQIWVVAISRVWWTSRILARGRWIESRLLGRCLIVFLLERTLYCLHKASFGRIGGSGSWYSGRLLWL